PSIRASGSSCTRRTSTSRCRARARWACRCPIPLPRRSCSTPASRAAAPSGTIPAWCARWRSWRTTRWRNPDCGWPGTADRLFACAALAIGALAGNAAAQTYPSKPIRLVVPFAPGGPADIQARLIGPKLTEAWGQPVVVENRAGGNTIIATELTAKADPDGHWIQIISASFAINVSLYNKLPYDSVRDFA